MAGSKRLILALVLGLFLMHEFHPVSSNASDCHKALGMEHEMIVDEQLSASSEENNVGKARLNSDSEWKPHKDDNDRLFQVRFGNVVNITAVATQGHHDHRKMEFVTQYKLEYRQDNSVWHTVKNETSDDDMIFIGHPMESQNGVNPVLNNLTNPIRATAIRIRILTGRGGKDYRFPLRFELYGCTASSCGDALGMTDRRITDSHLSASSDNSNAQKARLFRTDGAWTGDSSSWIKVTFDIPVIVMGITTQGKPNADEHTMDYEVKFRFDDSQPSSQMDIQNIENETGDLTFIGNSDGDTPAFRRFYNPVILRELRIYPKQCHKDCAIRFELYGCEYLPTTPPPKMTTTSGRLMTTSLAPSTSTLLPSTTTSIQNEPSVGQTETSAIQTGTASAQTQVSTLKPGNTTSTLQPSTITSSQNEPSAAGQTENASAQTQVSTLKAGNSAPINGDAIIGGAVVGVLTVIVMLAILVCFLKRRKGSDTGSNVRKQSEENGLHNIALENAIKSHGKINNGASSQSKEGDMPEYAVVYTDKDESMPEYAVVNQDNEKEIPEYLDIYQDNHPGDMPEYAVVNKEEDETESDNVTLKKKTEEVPTYEVVNKDEDGDLTTDNDTEGWMDNSIYATTDSGNQGGGQKEVDNKGSNQVRNVGGPDQLKVNNGTEGWMDNSIYATTDNDNEGGQNEGWEDNIIYAAGK
ncbi:uncharacterized protein [Amphiura filiformis]|uniref:uncharacterized protein n=1 Tax=Amphiura filiformis TaxID=82378 RepID=UPI003B222ECD